jgi:hypothetical protein
MGLKEASMRMTFGHAQRRISDERLRDLNENAFAAFKNKLR